MTVPLAYFLTWTCYGTWLHGDERGSVDLDNNQSDRPYLPAHESRQKFEATTLGHPAIILNGPMRSMVRDTVVERCKFTNTRLLALSVRLNHVHLVVSCNQPQPGKLAGGFKARCTRMLRDSNLITKDQRVWTKNASTKYLWDQSSLCAAVDYVTRHQGPPDEFTIGPNYEPT